MSGILWGIIIPCWPWFPVSFLPLQLWTNYTFEKLSFVEDKEGVKYSLCQPFYQFLKRYSHSLFAINLPIPAKDVRCWLRKVLIKVWWFCASESFRAGVADGKYSSSSSSLPKLVLDPDELISKVTLLLSFSPPPMAPLQSPYHTQECSLYRTLLRVFT